MAPACRLGGVKLAIGRDQGSVEALVRQERDWVPSGQEKSLYLRPFMIATEVGLGVRPANQYDYYLIASPAGAYFPRGVKPVDLLERPLAAGDPRGPGPVTHRRGDDGTHGTTFRMRPFQIVTLVC